MLSVHDILKAHDIVPTMDCEKAYKLGCEKGYSLGVEDAKGDESAARRAESRVQDLEIQLREMKLMAERVLRRG